MKRILFIFFLAFSHFVIAQEVTVQSTEEYTNRFKNAYWDRVLGHDETGYYLLREFGIGMERTVVLEKYSNTLKMLFTTDIESTSGVMNNAKYHQYTEWSNGKVYVFLNGWNKSQQQCSFHVEQVQQDGSLSGNTIELEIEPATSMSKSAFYSVSFSPDGSKLLVLTEKTYVKGSKEKIRLQVFNTSDFSSVWKKDLTLENDAEKGPVNEITIDNEGNAYMFKELRGTDKTRYYQIVTVGQEHFHVSPIDLKGYAPGQKKMLINPAGKLILSGILGPFGRKVTDWQATWYCEIASSGQIIHNRIEPLGESLLSMLVSPKSAAKEGYVLENYVLKDVLLKPSGGLFLLTEEHNHTSRPVNGPGLPPLSYEYDLHFGNGLVISFDAQGEREWNVILDKAQKEKTINPKVAFGSYAYQLKDEKLYLVWNFTDLKMDLPPMPVYRYWVDINKRKINIDNLFGREALYPTLLTVIDNQGNFVYDKRTFKSLPLDAIQKPNAFKMAVDPVIFFPTEKGMVILSHMSGLEAQRYKFNTIMY